MGAALAISLAAVPSAHSANLTGGNIKAVVAAVSDGYAEGTETFAPLVGAARTITVPAGGDSVIATFTAECRMHGSTSSNSWVAVEIRDNGVAMLPSGPSASRGFCSDESYGSHQIRVIKRLSAGDHTISVAWRIVKNVSSDNVNATLDDWALTVLQAE
jgi:hypothetical protein